MEPAHTSGSEMRLLFWTDPHLADRPPIARSSRYCDEIFEKINEIKDLARSVDLTILGGDLYHNPRPRDVSHALVRRTIEFLRDWPTDLLVVVGNHDQVPEQLAGLSRTPLGVVLEALAGSQVRLLNDEVCGGVQLSAAHWSHDLDENPDLYQLQHHDKSSYAIKVVHGMCLPPGEYPFPCVTMDQVQTGADIVLLGHMHWVTEPVRYNGTLFVGPGAIARTARAQYVSDNVYVAILSLSNGCEPEVELRSLKSARPADEVFAWTEPRESPTAGLFAGYVAVLESGLDVGGLSVEDALAQVEAQAPEGVVKRTQEYLKEAGL